MSLQRTPPMSPLPSVFATPLQILQSYPSDSNVSEVGEEAGLSAASSLSNVTSRPKRKRDVDEVTKSEMMEMFTALQKRQDEKFDTILCSINEIKSSVNVMATKYEVALKQINSLEQERKVHKTQIQELQTQVETLQRYVRGSSVEIRNIPQNQNESKDNLKKMVGKLAGIFNIPWQGSDIKDIYRINSKAAVKPIIVDFSTVSMRDQFLTSYKNYNKKNKHGKLNTSLLHFGGESQPVYLSENMTPKARKLFYQTREFAKNHNYAFCWASFGRIFLRKEEGSPQICVTCEADLQAQMEQ